MSNFGNMQMGMQPFSFDKDLSLVFKKAGELSKNDEMITPEHLLLAICENSKFKTAFESCGGDIKELKSDLKKYLNDEIGKLNTNFPVESNQFITVLTNAVERMLLSNNKQLKLDFIVEAIINLDDEEDSYASYFIKKQNIDTLELISKLSSNQINEKNKLNDNEKKELFKYVTHLNEYVKTKPDPIIGRQDILKRTIQILCRRNKNNPIHIGEPGVGKTAVTIGLAKLVNEGKVPEKLKNSNIFSLDLGSIMAGTQYRGDFEQRLKSILDSITKFENPIVYIDEIHNIVGAGANSNSSLDASNILKPYLTESSIKFIGATTYDEYKKYFEKDKALVRRFQTIDVHEPSQEETIKIINGLKQYYEEYHDVKYSDEAIKTAVELSIKYINNRFLPDKAIDIIDEAGALTTVDCKPSGYIINKEDIENVISKICNIPKNTVENNEI